MKDLFGNPRNLEKIVSHFLTFLLLFFTSLFLTHFQIKRIKPNNRPYNFQNDHKIKYRTGRSPEFLRRNFYMSLAPITPLTKFVNSFQIMYVHIINLPPRKIDALITRIYTIII